MDEVSVRLLCPTCSKAWAVKPERLPSSDDTLSCPDCSVEAATAEFMRTARDLEIYKQFAE